MMKIAIVVHGRFHAFDLARELSLLGHHVRVFTNYPRWSAPRFGLKEDEIIGFPLHGALVRVAGAVERRLGFRIPGAEAGLHRLFGWWAARQVVREEWDVIHAFSGGAEELLRGARSAPVILMRGSSHVQAQLRILEQEEARSGVKLDKPSMWMLGRECREYELADEVLVLSEFAARTFREEGYPAERLVVSPLGSSMAQFRVDETRANAREQRILAGAPLQVLFVGTLSMRKGAPALLEAARTLSKEGMRFRIIADVTPEAASLAEELRQYAEVLPRQPQQELPRWQAEADLFLFPTLEDGYAMVLAQAVAAGLGIFSSTHCAAPDLVEDGVSGVLFAPRDTQRMLEKLRWANAHRPELAAMLRRSVAGFVPRDWKDVAVDFARHVTGRDAPAQRRESLKV
jgi:glycosyltransferase involved in cell wall biosynthesis